jgi:hypothetical protein
MQTEQTLVSENPIFCFWREHFMIGGERELLPSQRRNWHEHNVKIEEEMFMDQKNNGVFVLIVNYFLVLKPPQKMIHILVCPKTATSVQY